MLNVLMTIAVLAEPKEAAPLESFCEHSVGQCTCSTHGVDLIRSQIRVLLGDGKIKTQLPSFDLIEYVHLMEERIASSAGAAGGGATLLVLSKFLPDEEPTHLISFAGELSETFQQEIVAALETLPTARTLDEEILFSVKFEIGSRHNRLLQRTALGGS